MSYHKELLSELVENWNVEKIDLYLFQLKERREQLNEWIRHVQLVRRKKVKKAPLDTGARDGH